jgi:hypothetical protein
VDNWAQTDRNGVILSTCYPPGRQSIHRGGDKKGLIHFFVHGFVHSPKPRKAWAKRTCPQKKMLPTTINNLKEIYYDK